MIRRVFWLAAGAVAGSLVVRGLTRTARAFTPAGVAAKAGDTVGGFGHAIRDFVADVREGASQRERELREAALTDSAGDRP